MNEKQRVAEQATTFVEEGMLIGLGTGSTADCFIEALAKMFHDGLNIAVVASSIISQIKAAELGLPLRAIEQISALDLYVDGADEVAPDLTLLKGQGADLVKEKILARAAERFLVLIDQSKLVGSIGSKFAIPVEVTPFAWQIVKTSLEKMSGQVQIRRIPGKDNPMLSSHGSLILDCVFSECNDISQLNEQLDALPGVVEHGIFHKLVHRVLIGHQDSVEQRCSEL